MSAIADIVAANSFLTAKMIFLGHVPVLYVKHSLVTSVTLQCSFYSRLPNVSNSRTFDVNMQECPFCLF